MRSKIQSSVSVMQRGWQLHVKVNCCTWSSFTTQTPQTASVRSFLWAYALLLGPSKGTWSSRNNSTSKTSACIANTVVKGHITHPLNWHFTDLPSGSRCRALRWRRAHLGKSLLHTITAALERMAYLMFFWVLRIHFVVMSVFFFNVCLPNCNQPKQPNTSIM